MATKKKAQGNKKGSKSQSQNVEVPTLMGAVEAMDRQVGGNSVPRRRKEPRITPKFRKLR